MNPSNTEVCRLCGSVKEAQDLVCELNDTADGKSTMKDCVEFYCRVKLNNGKRFSQKICRNCRLQIDLFISFCVNLGKVQSKIQESPVDLTAMIKASNTETKQENEDENQLRISLSEEQLLEAAECQNSSIMDLGQKKRRPRARSSLQSIHDLYHDSFDMGMFELDHYSHVSVEHDCVAGDGEVARDWLRNFGAENDTWMQFNYHCTHCEEPFQSFIALLNHFKLMPFIRLKIKCPHCEKTFSATNSYINHAVKTHFEHLAFTCICCQKLFYNIITLIKHYMESHPTISCMYPCIECGHYCANLTQLKVHMMGHDETQEFETDSSDLNSDSSEDNADEDDENDAQYKKTDDENGYKSESAESFRKLDESISSSEAGTSNDDRYSSIKTQRKRKKEAMNPPAVVIDGPGPSYHPRVLTNKKRKSEIINGVFCPAEDRKTYPCDQCNRILMTYPGFQYHLLTHSGEKPFPCTKCKMTFRSRTGLQSHAKNMHE